VTFDYEIRDEDRLDPFSDYRPGFEIRTASAARASKLERTPKKSS
jgi:hypothetical protein